MQQENMRAQAEANAQAQQAAAQAEVQKNQANAQMQQQLEQLKAQLILSKTTRRISNQITTNGTRVSI